MAKKEPDYYFDSEVSAVVYLALKAIDIAADAASSKEQLASKYETINTLQDRIRELETLLDTRS